MKACCPVFLHIFKKKVRKFFGTNKFYIKQKKKKKKTLIKKKNINIIKENNNYFKNTQKNKL